MATGDLDGDDDADLVVTNQGAQDVSVLLGTGDGNFTQVVRQPVGKSPQAEIAVDLNADGYLDLAVANRASDDVSILLGRGSGTFLPGALRHGRFAELGDRGRSGRRWRPGPGRDQRSLTHGVGAAGAGDGSYGEPRDYVTGNGPNSVVATGVDGNAVVDLVVATSSSLRYSTVLVAACLMRSNTTPLVVGLTTRRQPTSMATAARTWRWVWKVASTYCSVAARASSAYRPM